MTDYIETTGALQAVTSNHPVLIALNEKVAKLEKDLAEKETYRASVADQLRSARYDNDKRKLNLKDTLAELIEDEDITYDTAKRIADIFDIALTKRIEVEYKISATVTVEVPMNFDEDDITDHVYCDRVDFSSYSDECEVLESDYEVEDWNIRS